MDYPPNRSNGVEDIPTSAPKIGCTLLEMFLDGVVILDLPGLHQFPCFERLNDYLMEMYYFGVQFSHYRNIRVYKSLLDQVRIERGLVVMGCVVDVVRGVLASIKITFNAALSKWASSARPTIFRYVLNAMKCGVP